MTGEGIDTPLIDACKAERSKGKFRDECLSLEQFWSRRKPSSRSGGDTALKFHGFHGPSPWP
jgi:hypothetical protein